MAKQQEQINLERDGSEGKKLSQVSYAAFQWLWTDTGTQQIPYRIVDF